MKDSNYIVILAPMVNVLGLKGNDLIIFALIHGFTQDGNQSFSGSSSYIQKWTGLNKSSIYTILKKLTEKGFIQKEERFQNGVKFCEYKSLLNEIISNHIDKEDVIGVDVKSNRGYLENPMGVDVKSNGGTWKTRHNSIFNNIDNKEKELKENEFSSESLKSFWNDTCKSYAKCHRINADSYNKLMTQMKKNSITTDDLKKAMLILESLDIDNHFKGGNDRGWKASITWLMQNTKGCIVRLLDGEMSYSRTEKESYKRIINSNDLEVDKNYIPRAGTNLLQDEDGIYRTHERPNRETIYDGYTNDNRPSMTLIRFLNDTYFWNVGTKTWYKQEKD